MSDIQQQIAAAEARRQQALQAEQQRLANEQANRQQVAQESAEIARLNALALDEAIDKRIKAAQDAADALRALGQDLVEALQAFDIPSAMALGEKISTYTAGLVAFNKRVLTEAQPLLDQKWREAEQTARSRGQAAGWPIGDRRTDDLAISIFNEYKTQLAQRLPSAPDFIEQIRAWVQAVESGKQRQIRQGIAYALTGWFCDQQADPMLVQWRRPIY